MGHGYIFGTMVASVEQITTDALALSFEERTKLLSFLLESVDAEGSFLLSDAWVEELKRRQQAVRSGAETFAAEDVFEELRRESSE